MEDDNMYTISLNDSSLDFKTLEENIYKIVCEIACDVFKNILEKLDKMLMATRDVNEYRNKGYKKDPYPHGYGCHRLQA